MAQHGEGDHRTAEPTESGEQLGVVGRESGKEARSQSPDFS